MGAFENLTPPDADRPLIMWPNVEVCLNTTSNSPQGTRGWALGSTPPVHDGSAPTEE